MRPTRSSADPGRRMARTVAAIGTAVALGSLVAACSSDKLEPVATAPETLAPVGVTPTTRFIEVTTTAPAGPTVASTATSTASSAAGGVTTSSGPQGVASNPGAELPPLTGFGIGTTMFDDAADTAIRSLTNVFGTPSADSGWVAAGSSPFGACPGQHVRGVRWGQLLTLYGDQGGAQHFFTYTYGLGNR